MIPSTSLLATHKTAGGGGSVSITDQNVSVTGTGPASYSINSDGTVKNQVPTTLETWLVSGVNSDFEVRATVVSGTSPTGSALNTWLSCSTTRTWSENATLGSIKTCTLTIELRDAAAPNTVRDTATITITNDNS